MFRNVFTSSRHVSFKYIFEIIVSYLGHFIPTSATWKLTELLGPLQAFQPTFPAIVYFHMFFHSSPASALCVAKMCSNSMFNDNVVPALGCFLARLAIVRHALTTYTHPLHDLSRSCFAPSLNLSMCCARFTLDVFSFSLFCHTLESVRTFRFLSTVISFPLRLLLL